MLHPTIQHVYSACNLHQPQQLRCMQPVCLEQLVHIIRTTLLHHPFVWCRQAFLVMYPGSACEGESMQNQLCKAVQGHRQRTVGAHAQWTQWQKLHVRPVQQHPPALNAFQPAAAQTPSKLPAALAWTCLHALLQLQHNRTDLMPVCQVGLS